MKEAGLAEVRGAAASLPRSRSRDVRVPSRTLWRIFAPQKGADPTLVKRLEERLDELAATFPRDPRGEPMTGAAGGLSGGLWAALGAQLVPGAPYVLDAIGFDGLMRGPPSS